MVRERTNVGRTKLLVALREATRRELAARLGVSAMTVSRWASGDEVPSRYVDRKALRDELGIGLDDWDQNERQSYKTCVKVGL